MTESNPVKQHVPTVIGLVIMAIIIFLAQWYMTRQPSFDEHMVKMASEINEQCPVMMDEHTRLDNTMAFPGKNFQYNYSLVDIAGNNVDTAAFRYAITPVLQNSIKTSPDMKKLRDEKVTFSYAYRDMAGNHLLKIVITPDDYLN